MCRYKLVLAIKVFLKVVFTPIVKFFFLLACLLKMQQFMVDFKSS